MKRLLMLLLILFLCACGQVAKVSAVQETAFPTAAPTVSPTAAPTIPPTPVFVAVTKAPVTEVPATPTPTATPEETFTPQPSDIPETAAPMVSSQVVRQDLSQNCTFRCSQQDVSRYAFTDNNLQSSTILAEGTTLSYAWEATISPEVLYLFAYMLPDSFTIIQKDDQNAVLSQEELIPERMCSQVPLLDGCRSVSITCNGRCKLNALQVFGEGDVFPAKTVWWDEPKEYCELLLVSTHFDDEILMMGSVFPIYAGDQHRDCAIIYTVNESDRVRQMEAMQGLWEMGVKREPVVLSFDYYSMNRALNNNAKGIYKKNDDLATMVGLLRKLRPLVVVTHDVNGEYGHREHIKTSALVRRAVELASDATYDPDSVKQYGVWQVQKEYIHMWKENPLLLDVKTPLINMNRRTAMQVARDAFAFHRTQQKWSVDVQNRKNPIGQFGLYFTTVGPDSGINDMFENVIPPAEPQA